MGGNGEKSIRDIMGKKDNIKKGDVLLTRELHDVEKLTFLTRNWVKQPSMEKEQHENCQPPLIKIEPVFYEIFELSFQTLMRRVFN